MKTLYRSRKNKIIGGVAGGVAEYLAVDPMIVRLVFFGLLFVAPFIIVYIAAWIFVPLST